jgi:hypothetical protein
VAQRVLSGPQTLAALGPTSQLEAMEPAE